MLQTVGQEHSHESQEAAPQPDLCSLLPNCSQCIFLAQAGKTGLLPDLLSCGQCFLLRVIKRVIRTICKNFRGSSKCRVGSR